MIHTLFRTQAGTIETNLTPAQIPSALQDHEGLLWIDFLNEPPHVCEPILRETFGFHPLAIDDALEEIHVPKLDDWGDYLYLVLRDVVFDAQTQEEVTTRELDIFLGKNFLVTLHEYPSDAVSRVWAACEHDQHHFLKRGPGYLLYKIIDELVERYIPVVETLEDMLDTVEAQLFNNPAPSALEDIFNLKESLLHLRRILLPQREVLNKLARDKFKVVRQKDQIFFRDVYDHLFRLYDITENMRELVTSALNTYLSVVNNRMNDVMKTLTIFTALFMPLTFIVGFFGMNFFEASTPFPWWTAQDAFLLVLLGMILLPVLMYLWMRRRGWM